MKAMVAIPCMEMIHTDFAQCMWAAKKVDETYLYVSKSSLVYESRNMIARAAMDRDFDFIVWFDSDMTFEPDVIERMAEHYKNGYDYVCGLFFSRRHPIIPVIYESISCEEDDRGVPKVDTVNRKDYPQEIFEVAGSGFGCVMTSVRMLRQICDIYGPPFYPRFGFGEDLTFCWLAKQCGIKMYCDPTIKLGHIGSALCNEEAYLKYK